jgi:hypothetical protein
MILVSVVAGGLTASIDQDRIVSEFQQYGLSLSNVDVVSAHVRPDHCCTQQQGNSKYESFH